MSELLPCPFCGGPVDVEETRPGTMGQRFWGVKCRNTLNVGGTCAIEQIPSGSRETAIARWNARAIPADRVLVDGEVKILESERRELALLRQHFQLFEKEHSDDLSEADRAFNARQEVDELLRRHLRANQGGAEHV